MKTKTSKVKRPKSKFFDLEELEGLSTTLDLSDEFFTSSETNIGGVLHLETALIQGGELEFKVRISKVGKKAKLNSYAYDGTWHVQS